MENGFKDLNMDEVTISSVMGTIMRDTGAMM